MQLWRENIAIGGGDCVDKILPKTTQLEASFAPPHLTVCDQRWWFWSERKPAMLLARKGIVVMIGGRETSEVIQGV